MNRDQAKKYLPIIEALAKGEEIQMDCSEAPFYDKQWVSLIDPSFIDGSIYRIKPKTRLINGVECPMPLTSLEGFAAIFVPCLAFPRLYDLYDPRDFSLATCDVDLNVCFTTKEDAITTAKAILKGLEI